METPVYEEIQTMRFRNLYMVLPATILVIAFFADRSNVMSIFMALLISIIASVCIWGFTSLSIRITPTQLQFGFILWNRRIPLSAVKVGQVIPIPFLAGTGIHYWNRYWVYNVRRGHGLILEVNKRKYLLGSGQPERLQGALWQVANRLDI